MSNTRTTTAKKATVKKTTAKKATTTKATTTKAATKKATTTKAPAKKAPAKKAPAKKAPATKAPAKKAPATKAPAKKAAGSTSAKSSARPDPGGNAGPRNATLLSTASELQARMMMARTRGLTIGFVPTMGALHAGHAALIDEARRRADIVVVSIFVNPKQFGPKEDLSSYPRPLDADLAVCARCGVDYVFHPGVDDVYPAGFDTKIVAGALAADLEGAARPGHFDGVLTVVNLLFSIVQPHFAVFGEKDYQQLQLVRRMVTDLRMPVEVVAMPVVRDVDGLALSSRNAYLSADDRAKATCVYRALMAGQDAVQRGEKDPGAIATAARSVLRAVEGAEVAYAAVRDAKTLKAIDKLEQPGRLLLAVKLGGVRLIDNGPLFPDVRWKP
jgi:pantoate--beta-alanine ligase